MITRQPRNKTRLELWVIAVAFAFFYAGALAIIKAPPHIDYTPHTHGEQK